MAIRIHGKSNYVMEIDAQTAKLSKRDRPKSKDLGFRKVMRKHLWNAEANWTLQRSSLLPCQARR